MNKDNLPELIEAGKALHIKGLEDMVILLNNFPIRQLFIVLLATTFSLAIFYGW